MNMNPDRPLILLTNDDGIRAKGINDLLAMLMPLGEVIVVAPESGRSGAGCSITSDCPVTVKEVRRAPGLALYQCSGSPADCVKLALEQVAPRRPDVLVSGINHGDNASVSVFYSGTMGAVLEGCMKGLPAVGFSLRTSNPAADFSACKPYVQRIVQRMLDEGLPSGVCLNVNFPEGMELQGLRVCRMARGNWSSEWMPAAHPKGERCYWLTGAFGNLEPEAEDTDMWALDHGFVSMVPTQVDVTALMQVQKMKNWEER